MRNDAQLEELSRNRGFELLEEAFGYEIVDILRRDDVLEVYCNGTSPNLYVEYMDRGRVKENILLAAKAREKIIKIVSTFCKTDVGRDNPLLTATLPKFGYRFESSLPEVSLMPSFNIRKPALVIFTLQDYVDKGTFDEKYKEVFELAVRKKLNIVISGSTGSGKTTFGNAILKEVSLTGDRLILIEENRELQCDAEDYESLVTTYNINCRMLIRTCMRRRPDRIIVGEVRDGVAYDLLKAWNTGHPGGVCTIHANSSADTFRRLEALALEAGGDGVGAPPIDFIKDLIGSTVGLVGYIERVYVTENGVTKRYHKLNNLLYVKGYDFQQKKYILETDIDVIKDIIERL